MEGSSAALLPAEDWCYDLDSLETLDNFRPPLYRFVDSLVEVWLNVPVSESRNQVRFALYIGCLIYYCYRLTDGNGKSVSTNEYAEHLKPEHREFHYDFVTTQDNRTGFTTTYRHRYHVGKYNEIKQGEFLPKLYREGGFRPELSAHSE